MVSALRTGSSFRGFASDCHPVVSFTLTTDRTVYYPGSGGTEQFKVKQQQQQQQQQQFHSDTTEKLLTGALSLNTNKQTNNKIKKEHGHFFSSSF